MDTGNTTINGESVRVTTTAEKQSSVRHSLTTVAPTSMCQFGTLTPLCFRCQVFL